MEIKKYRERAGISKTELAQIMDVDLTAVLRWETGEAMPRAAKIPKLADLLHCTIDELFGRDEAETTVSKSKDEKAACSKRDYKRLEKVLAENFDDSDSSITIKAGSDINSDR